MMAILAVVGLRFGILKHNEDETMSTGWSIANNDPSTFKVSIGSQSGVPIDEITNRALKTFIGSISGGLDRMRFVPVRESPERPIKRRQL